MLTKDLLEFTHRKGRIYPTFIEEHKTQLVRAAKELTAVYAMSPGRKASEIEAASLEVEGREACLPGLRKILSDRCTFEDTDDSVIQKRWDVFRVAQELRDEGAWGSAEDFAKQIAERCESSCEELRMTLFADHPDERRCQEFESIDAETLLAEYNRSLLQTLFIFADDVKITIKGASTPEKRAFFRQLKFHSLMSQVDVNPDDAALTVQLSGPLKLFQKSTTYGLRLAKFIPNVLFFKYWEIDATIHLKNKYFELKLNQDCGVKPRPGARGLSGYIPEEFVLLEEAFNTMDQGWKLKLSDDFVMIGKQSYCFPDLDLIKDKEIIHVELFHGWHKGQLLGRLQALRPSKVKSLVIGVDKSLLKDKDTQKAVAESPWFKTFGFEFSQFPTPKQILKVLER